MIDTTSFFYHHGQCFISKELCKNSNGNSVSDDIVKFHIEIFENAKLVPSNHISTITIYNDIALIFTSEEYRNIFQKWWKNYENYYKKNNQDVFKNKFMYLILPHKSAITTTLLPISRANKEWAWITENCNKGVFKLGSNMNVWAFESEEDAAMFVLQGEIK